MVSSSSSGAAYIYDYTLELADERRMQAKLRKEDLTPAELARVRRLEEPGAVASDPPSPIRHLCLSSSARLAQLEAMPNYGFTEMHSEALQAAPYWYTPALPPDIAGGRIPEQRGTAPLTEPTWVSRSTALTHAGHNHRAQTEHVLTSKENPNASRM